MTQVEVSVPVVIVDRTQVTDAVEQADHADVVISRNPTGAGLVVEGYSDGATLKAALELAISVVGAAASQRGRDALLRALIAAKIDPVEPASLHQARRQATLMARLLTTPAYTYDTLAEVRGDRASSATRTWVSRVRKEGRVFSVSQGGRTLLPALQFDDTGDIRDDIASLVRPLLAAGMGAIQIWAWLVNPTPLLSGLVPAEAVADPETADRARTAAARVAARVQPRQKQGQTKPSETTRSTRKRSRTPIADKVDASPKARRKSVAGKDPKSGSRRSRKQTTDADAVIRTSA